MRVGAISTPHRRTTTRPCSLSPFGPSPRRCAARCVGQPCAQAFVPHHAFSLPRDSRRRRARASFRSRARRGRAAAAAAASSAHHSLIMTRSSHRECSIGRELKARSRREVACLRWLWVVGRPCRRFGRIHSKSCPRECFVRIPNPRHLALGQHSTEPAIICHIHGGRGWCSGRRSRSRVLVCVDAAEDRARRTTPAGLCCRMRVECSCRRSRQVLIPKYVYTVYDNSAGLAMCHPDNR